MSKDERIRELENTIAQLDSICDWVGQVLDGKEVSEFAESFPLVRKAMDIVVNWRNAETGAQRLAERIYDYDALKAELAAAKKSTR